MFGVSIYPWGYTLYTEGNSFKSLNFDFHSLIGVSDSEVFIVLILIYFSFLIHVKISAMWAHCIYKCDATKSHCIYLKKIFLT